MVFTVPGNHLSGVAEQFFTQLGAHATQSYVCVVCFRGAKYLGTVTADELLHNFSVFILSGLVIYLLLA